MREIEERKREDVDALRKNMLVIANLLNEKLRIASNPYSISRADFAIEKFAKFIELTGTKKILANIECSFEELNRSLTNYYENKRAKKLVILTYWLIPPTIIIAGLTGIIAGKELADNSGAIIGCKVVCIIIGLIGVCLLGGKIINCLLRRRRSA